MITRKPEQSFESAKGPAPNGESAETRVTYDDKLNHILEIATALIAREGYEKASMRSVAKATGVSLAGLYHYFDSKEKMLFLIQFRTFNFLLNNLREKLHGVTEPIKRLQVMVRAHVTYFGANLDELRVCSHELDVLTGDAYQETLRIRREYYELSRSIVDQIFAAHGANSTLDPHVATMSLFGTLNWLYRWYDPKRDRAPTTLANHIIDQFLGGILGAHKGTTD